MYDCGMAPKLLGYRECLPMNVYDCVSPRDLLNGPLDGRRKLFGVEHIGHLVMSNICVPNVMSSDQTTVLANWYARTNIDTSLPEWRGWANATTVTFVLGSMPVLQLPLADLVANREGGKGMIASPDLATTEAEFKDRRDRIARRTAVAYYGSEDPSIFDEMNDDRWYVAARAAIGQAAPRIVIPVRAAYSVIVESDSAATRAFVETMPTNVAPQSLVWIHLEGVWVRDRA